MSNWKFSGTGNNHLGHDPLCKFMKQTIPNWYTWLEIPFILFLIDLNVFLYHPFDWWICVHFDWFSDTRSDIMSIYWQFRKWMTLMDRDNVDWIGPPFEVLWTCYVHNLAWLRLCHNVLFNFKLMCDYCVPLHGVFSFYSFYSNIDFSRVPTQ